MFKIIHLSDLHVSAQPKTANLLDFIEYNRAGGVGGATFEACVAHGVSQRSHCPDIALGVSQFLSTNLLDHHVILVGGDVATTGTAVDMEFASAFLKSKPQLMFTYRTSSGMPTLGARSKIAVMPGNHDRFQDKWCKSNGVIFESFFSKEWGAPGNRVRDFKIRNKITGKFLQ